MIRQYVCVIDGYIYHETGETYAHAYQKARALYLQGYFPTKG